jgi:hypothetical protein
VSYSPEQDASKSDVDHVFARQKGPMDLVIRTIGLARATVKIGLANLTYDMKRAVWLSARIAAEQTKRSLDAAERGPRGADQRRPIGSHIGPSPHASVKVIAGRSSLAEAATSPR